MRTQFAVHDCQARIPKRETIVEVGKKYKRETNYASENNPFPDVNCIDIQKQPCISGQITGTYAYSVSGPQRSKEAQKAQVNPRGE